MKITSTRVIVSSPGRFFVTLKIETGQGVYGIGDARLNGRELAVGEIFNSIWDAKDPIQNQLIDFMRCTGLGAGGITHLRCIANLAALFQVRTGRHGATDLSPVSMGCALHFDTWVPNFGIREYMRHSPETDAVFANNYSFADGHLMCGETPGHGPDIDEELAAKYPCKRACLPVARLDDGTMWNW